MTEKGFFIPHRYARSVRRVETYLELTPLLRAAEPSMHAVLAAIDRHADIVEAFNDTDPPAPRWQQDWFPGLDGAAAYVLVRERRPAQILEIGSGHSTRFLARAVADGGLDTTITCVDPAPRADLDRLT
ncbi:MAG: class I SAM-dependent methyltransferase, partial [Alphaproteobacteria bacterium]|nr:class I SAM-dependent methyltransferase [Alphaproteobacteria bacterium]